MGSKLIRKVNQFKTDTDNMFEIYETEDGDTLLYATFNITEIDRLSAYKKLQQLLSMAIKDEQIMKQIVE
jgi:hypothetical protein